MKFASRFLIAGSMGVTWLLLLAAGCGGPENIGRVSGVVTLDGQPLSGALVMFSPESGSPSAGRTDADGKYTLDFSSDVQGAQIGKHQVTISTFRAASPDADPPVERSPKRVPAKYNVSSELTATVESGSNTLNFDLKSDGPVVQPESRRE